MICAKCLVVASNVETPCGGPHEASLSRKYNPNRCYELPIGANVRKYGRKLLIRPSKDKVLGLLRDLRGLIRTRRRPRR